MHWIRNLKRNNACKVIGRKITTVENRDMYVENRIILKSENDERMMRL